MVLSTIQFFPGQNYAIADGKKRIYGETKLICWSTGPTVPILNKQKKITIIIILQNFGQLTFFLIYCFLLFEKKKRKTNKT